MLTVLRVETPFLFLNFGPYTMRAARRPARVIISLIGDASGGNVGLRVVRSLRPAKTNEDLDAGEQLVPFVEHQIGDGVALATKINPGNVSNSLPIDPGPPDGYYITVWIGNAVGDPQGWVGIESEKD